MSNQGKAPGSRKKNKTTETPRPKEKGTVDGHVIVKKSIHDLHRAEYNPRRITKESLNGLKASIDRFGLVQPIVWNKRTGNVVGGHQRLSALEMMGESEVEVIEVDLSEQEEKALNLSMNNQAIQGDWEPGLLSPLLEEIKEFPEIDFGELRLDSLMSIVKGLGEDVAAGTMTTRDQSSSLKEGYYVEVKCGSEQEQIGLIERLISEGFNCRALVL